jgi:sugar phosphate isomerase/epimerase
MAGDPHGEPRPRCHSQDARRLCGGLRQYSRAGLEPHDTPLAGDVFDPALEGYWGHRDLDAARGMVEEGIDLLAPYAAELGVKLGIEPFHPALMTERSVIVTLALDIAERFDPDHVGVVIDVYHVFWDPDLFYQIARASRRILGFHVNDWVVPTRDPLLERGMMGDGVIELGRIRAAVDDAGYAGPIEVEIFNPEIWNQPGDEILATVKERYAALV